MPRKKAPKLEPTDANGLLAEDIEADRPRSPLESDGTRIELFFGLVGPTGVDLTKVYESLKTQLQSVNYEAVLGNL